MKRKTERKEQLPSGSKKKLFSASAAPMSGNYSFYERVYLGWDISLLITALNVCVCAAHGICEL